MNSKELIKRNVELQYELNEENKAYYDRILMYVRANMKKDTKITEETLYEILQHIIEVQAQGKNAAEVFGEDPSEFAKDIVEQLPEEPKKFQWLYGLELISILLGVYVATQGIPYLFDSMAPRIYLGSMAIKTLAILGGFGLIFVTVLKVIRKEGQNGKKGSLKRTLLFCLLFAGVTVGIGLLAVFLKPFGPSFAIPNFLPVLIGAILVGISIALSKTRN